jgi:DNA-directed RNA polymerase I subunit RPA1
VSDSQELLYHVDPLLLQEEVGKVVRRNGDSATVTLDRMMCNALNVLTSEVNKMLFPSGLQKPYPNNCLSLMTTTGAKGSLVGFCYLLLFFYFFIYFLYSATLKGF